MIKYIFSVLVVVFSCNSIFSSDGQVSLVSRITNAAKDLVTSDKFVGFTCGGLVALCAMHKRREIEAPMQQAEINHLNNLLTTSTEEINHLKDLLRSLTVERDSLNNVVTTSTEEINHLKDLLRSRTIKRNSLNNVVTDTNEINPLNQKIEFIEKIIELISKKLQEERTAYDKLQLKVALLLAHYPYASKWFDKNDHPNVNIIDPCELLSNFTVRDITPSDTNDIVDFLYTQANRKTNSTHTASAAAHASDGDDDTSQP